MGPRERSLPRCQDILLVRHAYGRFYPFRWNFDLRAFNRGKFRLRSIPDDPLQHAIRRSSARSNSLQRLGRNTLEGERSSACSSMYSAYHWNLDHAWRSVQDQQSRCPVVWVLHYIGVPGYNSLDLLVVWPKYRR